MQMGLVGVADVGRDPGCVLPRGQSVGGMVTIGLQFGSILTRATITGIIFGRAGLGGVLATSITNKNIPVVQGAVVLIGIGRSRR